MHNILHATFVNAEDGIRAVESLLQEGLSAKDISLILPQPESAAVEQIIAPHSKEEVKSTAKLHSAPVTKQSPVPTKEPRASRNVRRKVVMDAEEGVGLGLGLGLLTAMCVPGMGMIVGSGIIIADLMAGGAAVGSIAGGIYSYLIERGVADGIARVMSHHLEGGGTSLSVTVSDTRANAAIIRTLQGFGGHLIRHS